MNACLEGFMSDMSRQDRESLIRLAASLPIGDEDRRVVLRSVAKNSAAASLEDKVAAWALSSYKGDASFFVHGHPTSDGSLATSMLTALKSRFIANFFERQIGYALSELDDEASVSMEHQNEAIDIWNHNTKKFLLTMYKLHGNGKIPFGDRPDLIRAWLKKHRKA
jgi:hypothetical protein